MLNSFFSVLVLLSVTLTFVRACYLLATKRPSAALAAYLVVLPVPVFLSLCGLMRGVIASLSVIATTPTSDISNADISAACAVSLSSVFMAVMVSVPTYVVLAIGLLVRTSQDSAAKGAMVEDHVQNRSALLQPAENMTAPIPTIS